MWWIARTYTKPLDGELQVPYLNWNGDKRKLNANRCDNEWNEHNRFLFVRNLSSFSFTKVIVKEFSFVILVVL